MTKRIAPPVFLLVLLYALLAAAADRRGTIQNVDRGAIRANDFTRFIENIDWPSQDVVAAKRVANDLVRADIGDLKALLARALKKEVLPSDETMDSQVLALENLRNNSDYLLLRYQSGAYDFQIQDGLSLYILVSQRGKEPAAVDGLPDFVRATAFSVLNIPSGDDAGKEPIVSQSPVNVGRSGCGWLVYPASFPPPKYWYSGIRWWSDGHYVLFLTDKGLWHGEDYSKMAGPPPWAGAPRLFEYKRRAAQEKPSQ